MNKPCKEYAVFIKVDGMGWVQQSIPLSSYQEAQAHAKLVRVLCIDAKKTRVRKLQMKV
jgi:hypothetical protein